MKFHPTYAVLALLIIAVGITALHFLLRNGRKNGRWRTRGYESSSSGSSSSGEGAVEKTEGEEIPPPAQPPLELLVACPVAVPGSATWGTYLNFHARSPDTLLGAPSSYDFERDEMPKCEQLSAIDCEAPCVGVAYGCELDWKTSTCRRKRKEKPKVEKQMDTSCQSHKQRECCLGFNQRTCAAVGTTALGAPVPLGQTCTHDLDCGTSGGKCGPAPCAGVSAQAGDNCVWEVDDAVAEYGGTCKSST